MIFLMPDTCAWISFLEHGDLLTPLRTLDSLVAAGEVTLWTTKEISGEILGDKNKQSRYARAEKFLLDDMRRRLDEETDPAVVASILTIINSPDLYDRVDRIEESVSHIDDLVSRSTIIEDTDAVNRRVLDRIGQSLAPFHKEDKRDVRRCVNDAMNIEKFAEAAATCMNDDISVFVSQNRKDYATKNNPDKPHADYSDIFNERCLFAKSFVRTVAEISEMVLSEGSRGFIHSDRKPGQEIEAEIAVLDEHDWMYRHLARKQAIEDGTCRLAPGRTVRNPMRPLRIGEASWREDLETAEQKLVVDPGLPRAPDPYQAGFAAGAHRALTWVLSNVQSPARFLPRVVAPELPDDGEEQETRAA